ncbi:Hsp70 family protein [Rufibacter aurantiacus]|uniref:Hsp70 family protein n=1 Tax=Rufibacter aurantiacus TaxID=2817374 RepID=UPI001B317E27|nr:Hsp70 family protein [Rufibacter aurantiacus]
MATYHRVIGIDLGTTYSVVAAYNFDRQEVKVIPNRQNEPTTPSVVYIRQTGEVSIGKSAKEKQQQDPEGVLIEVKRLMGEKSTLNTKEMVTVRQKQYDPEVISAFILKELKACAERIIEGPVHDAVITVPAYFKESQKNATREAAKIAKLNPRLIINEPTAAAIAYGLDANEVQSFIVYDFGGGTFDVSIVRIENENTVEVVGTGGDSNLGGGDIDELLTKWFFHKMQQQFGRDLSENRKLRGKVRLEAEKVKINLCNEGANQEFYIANPFDGVEEVSFSISPQEFDQMVQPILEKTFDQVQIALESAVKNFGVTMEDIEAFILVGGSSKIPAVGKQLQKRFNKPVKSNLNPDEIVAMGAARMALNYDPSEAAVLIEEEIKPLESLNNLTGNGGEVTNTNIIDVVSHTLGVGLDEDLYDSLIPKDSIIPHRVSRRGYTTAKDNQTSILVPVYQGENKKASTNFKLGEVIIDGIRPEPKGFHEFEISFSLDASGIFFGDVKHLQTGVVKPIQLERGQGALTEKKIKELAEMVNSGNINPVGGTPPQPEDNVTALLNKAKQILPILPEMRRKELEIGIRQLEMARQNRNAQEMGAALVNLTMLLIDN